ncbi:R8 protein [Vermiconidia calcicola]|uniref:R8 protein n=1 Tax=Vermiconidia calcicola TaxID=1690605 RepID=A0ACC3MZF6_9PEZI|nr:R8 protein [Vermiconidia calcicola]
MFYSHEVLTSRKYGVATVWLVATLGSKSTLKKVSRKAILDVDVTKACETIVTPEAPMALRLQSHLLYGVARVYAQQCGYVLNDAETATNNMRLMFKAMRTSALDAEGGNKGRSVTLTLLVSVGKETNVYTSSDQLMLQDDPNFNPDLDLMPMDLDRLDFDMATTDDSHRSTLSPHSSQLTGVGIGSQHDIGGLIIPPSASSFIGGPVGGMAGLSVRGDSGAGARAGQGGFLDDDLGLEIDFDGNLRMSDAAPRQLRVPSARTERVDLGSAGGSARMPSEREEGQFVGDMLGQPDDDGFMPLQDDYMMAPEAEPFMPRAADQVPQQVTSEETAEAPLRRRARAAPKAIPLDTTMELRNGDLARWNANYVANMDEVLRHKNVSRAAAVAKKNAEYWMLGQGDSGPLSMFTGVKLLEALTGVKLTHAGEKRTRDDDEETDGSRRVRSRGEPSSDEIGRGFQDDGFMPMMGDDTIEQGREAPTPLDDRHLSSMMPWNQSAGSRRPTGLFSGAGQQPTSASQGGAGGPLAGFGRRGSRLTSASPLMGRGAEGADFDELQLPGSQGDVGMTWADEFELFGPAAQVDTQTAAQSQWQRAALDGESAHFLEFVQAGIQETDQARAEAPMGEEDDDTLMGTVDFEALLPPENHTCVVAAQAMLHVLALGTKNLLSVEQDEAFGPIMMRVIASL